MKLRNETLLEAKAKLEDEVEGLQSKLALMTHLQDENASLKVQMDSHSSVSNHSFIHNYTSTHVHGHVYISYAIS